jgi:hypothetical protein
MAGSKRRKWFIAAVILTVAVAVSLWIAAVRIRDRFEPFIRAQAVAWLEQRFHADVELASLRIHIPAISPLKMLFTRGSGTFAKVEGSGLQLRQKADTRYPPFLELNYFSFSIDLGAVFESPKHIDRITLSGMRIAIPPRREQTSQEDNGSSTSDVIIGEITATDAHLTILPKQAGKEPLRFDIASLLLKSVGKETAMQYQALLTNPKPAGLIHSTGSFGPWNADEPGDTPLNGHYVFEHADLSVFSAIAGILHSTGDFKGTLSAIDARGSADVPDFRLKISGNRVPLFTTFEVLVDGGNGNTVLKPVQAILGSTKFTTSGAVIKHEGDPRRSIALDVDMPAGNLQDVLRLAMKNTPFMEGTLALKTRIVLPPLTGTVKEKLILSGRFNIHNGRFLRSAMQSKIDALSRRGQGQPENEEITEVFSKMSGTFHMEDEAIRFRALTFSTPGADIKLAGSYDLRKDALDFHGSLKLRARISETMTGWKRWALKPIDPFFAKNGAGTFLRIRIEGTSKSPDFGLDHGRDTTSTSR